jgi:gamma-glutamyltranspeptidase/glutathione hydrolase
MDEYETSMLLPETAASIRSKILDDRTQDIKSYNPKMLASPENHGTSHIVTADGDGMTVTSTSTVNLLFGARLVVPETGVILNDEMNDFSIPHTRNEFGFVPSPINYIRGNKRPLSSITPIIVEHHNGTLYISIGAAGGSRIITSTVQALWHVLDRGLTLKEALDEPRIHDQLMPDATAFERTDERAFGEDVVESMRDRKHSVVFVGGHQSAVQGVRVLPGGAFEAASEPRQKDSGGLVVD